MPFTALPAVDDTGRDLEFQCGIGEIRLIADDVPAERECVRDDLSQCADTNPNHLHGSAFGMFVHDAGDGLAQRQFMHVSAAPPIGGLESRPYS